MPAAQPPKSDLTELLPELPVPPELPVLLEPPVVLAPESVTVAAETVPCLLVTPETVIVSPGWIWLRLADSVLVILVAEVSLTWTVSPPASVSVRVLPLTLATVPNVALPAPNRAAKPAAPGAPAADPAA